LNDSLHESAPGLSYKGRPGAVFILLALSALACHKGEEPPSRAVLELAEDTIHLERGVALADILVRSASATTPAFQPDTIRARPGDVVRFITADRHPHAIAFETTLLTPTLEEFLRRTSPLRSPPLIVEGASWVISFANAPAGEYPFVDLSQERGGAIIILPPEKIENRK
jgi:plastocyanin